MKQPTFTEIYDILEEALSEDQMNTLQRKNAEYRGKSWLGKGLSQLGGALGLKTTARYHNALKNADKNTLSDVEQDIKSTKINRGVDNKVSKANNAKENYNKIANNSNFEIVTDDTNSIHIAIDAVSQKPLYTWNTRKGTWVNYSASRDGTVSVKPQEDSSEDSSYDGGVPA